ncbi:MAG: FAD binding domain-containing protein [Chloroflexi bacterium]|nr:FAD binding domain-containing protein [Chloroflexota bacterium]
MKFEFLEPKTISEASQLLAQNADARVIAGGTALVLAIQNKLALPSALVSLARIPQLDFIRAANDGLHLGALATIRDTEHSRVVRDFCPALARAYQVVGNVRVRNQATVGGNLAEADYASDPPTMLMALDAKIISTSREILLRDFFLGILTTALAPAEILTEIIVPPLPASARAIYLRHTTRSAESRPSANAAVVADFRAGRVNELRVAVGAAVATPQRFSDIENIARGEKLSDALIQKIAEKYAARIEPLDDKLESAWYRREIVRVLVKRALHAAA